MIKKQFCYFLSIIFFFYIFCGIEIFSYAINSERAIVTILKASNEGHDFNLENDAYRDQLIELFSYTSYNQDNRLLVDLKRSKRHHVELAGGYQLTLTLQGVEEDRILVQALIRKDSKQYVDTVLSVLRPGVAFLGGPPINGGALIIVLEIGF